MAEITGQSDYFCATNHPRARFPVSLSRRPNKPVFFLWKTPQKADIPLKSLSGSSGYYPVAAIVLGLIQRRIRTFQQSLRCIAFRV